jgi:hypothetical protein
MHRLDSNLDHERGYGRAHARPTVRSRRSASHVVLANAPAGTPAKMWAVWRAWKACILEDLRDRRSTSRDPGSEALLNPCIVPSRISDAIRMTSPRISRCMPGRPGAVFDSPLLRDQSAMPSEDRVSVVTSGAMWPDRETVIGTANQPGSFKFTCVATPEVVRPPRLAPNPHRKLPIKSTGAP